MPQMAPYNWLNLYFMFTFIMIYLISYIFYTSLKNYTNKNKNLPQLKAPYPWKW